MVQGSLPANDDRSPPVRLRFGGRAGLRGGIWTEGLADATGTGVGGSHHIGGVVWVESSQQELLAEHG